MDYWIRVSENFIVAATLAAAEAYCYGDGRGHNKLETIGFVWGYKRVKGDKAIFFLDRLSISLSAERETASVATNTEALKLKRNFMEVLQPQYTLLGDLHTHPYEDASEVARIGGQDFSDGDYQALLSDDLLWLTSDNTPLMLAITVCRMKRVRASVGRYISDNIFQYNIGEFRMCINASAGYLDGGTRRCTKSVQRNARAHRTYLDLNPIFWNETGQREQPSAEDN